MLVDQPSITDVFTDSAEHDDAALLDRVHLLRNCGLRRKELVAALPDVPASTVRRLLARLERTRPTVDHTSSKLVATDVPTPTPQRGVLNDTPHGLAERERRAALKARTDVLLAPISDELARRQRKREAQLDGIEIPTSSSWLVVHAECKRSAESAEERRARARHRERRARDIAQLEGYGPDDHE